MPCSSSLNRNEKFVGAHLPPRLYRYLSLYALAKDISKTEVLIRALDCWIQSNETVEREDILVLEAASRMELHWKVLKASGSILSFERYLELSRDQLESKELKQEQIDLILSKIKDNGKKEQTGEIK